VEFFQDEPKNLLMKKFEIHMLLERQNKNQGDNDIFLLLSLLWTKCIRNPLPARRTISELRFRLESELSVTGTWHYRMI
jgi:hypothetical protein